MVITLVFIPADNEKKVQYFFLLLEDSDYSRPINYGRLVLLRVKPRLSGYPIFDAYPLIK